MCYDDLKKIEFEQLFIPRM